MDERGFSQGCPSQMRFIALITRQIQNIKDTNEIFIKQYNTDELTQRRRVVTRKDEDSNDLESALVEIENPPNLDKDNQASIMDINKYFLDTFVGIRAQINEDARLPFGSNDNGRIQKIRDIVEDDEKLVVTRDRTKNVQVDLLKGKLERRKKLRDDVRGKIKSCLDNLKSEVQVIIDNLIKHNSRSVPATKLSLILSDLSTLQHLIKEGESSAENLASTRKEMKTVEDIQILIRALDSTRVLYRAACHQLAKTRSKRQSSITLINNKEDDHDVPKPGDEQKSEASGIFQNLRQLISNISDTIRQRSPKKIEIKEDIATGHAKVNDDHFDGKTNAPSYPIHTRGQKLSHVLDHISNRLRDAYNRGDCGVLAMINVVIFILYIAILALVVLIGLIEDDCSLSVSLQEILWNTMEITHYTRPPV
ncbi:unnamed protein product [Owenia fusiformis]|uniref:Uncharacterized protein n=1 Tax=Owenia fusiformis TaxID=6347 RepID=A0A8J1U2L9_OWEFU|nr:unnamed protein product [Owenia fusiformis]